MKSNEFMLDKIGNWNPQLLRELNSRLTGNTLIAAVAIPILVQVIGVSFFVAADTPFISKVDSSFHFLNWLLPILAIIGGTYAICSDLNTEENRGTLNFIRLTPQSARNIFIGKILGVPSLVFLSVLLTIPLHFTLGMYTGIGLPQMLGWYLTIGSFVYLCLSLIIFYTLYSTKYVILLTLLFALPVNTLVSTYNYFIDLIITAQSSRSIDSIGFAWFYLPIGNNILLFDLFLIGTLLLISHWLWIAIERKYINFTSTAVKKEDSYWMNIQLQICLLGFALPIVTKISSGLNPELFDIWERFNILAIFYSISLVFGYLTIPLILPNRASIQDWIRDLQPSITLKAGWKWQQDLIPDLVWHDRSPILLAMLINSLIPALIWGLCFVVFNKELLNKSIVGIVITCTLTLIHTAIINLIYLRSTAKATGVIPMISLISFLPLCLGFMAVLSPEWKTFGLVTFLFSPYGWMSVTQLSLVELGMVFIGQMALLAGLNRLIQGKLYRLGRSGLQTIDRQKPELARANK
jgi:hypothetical protein